MWQHRRQAQAARPRPKRAKQLARREIPCDASHTNHANPQPPNQPVAPYHPRHWSAWTWLTTRQKTAMTSGPAQPSRRSRSRCSAPRLRRPRARPCLQVQVRFRRLCRLRRGANQLHLRRKRLRTCRAATRQRLSYSPRRAHCHPSRRLPPVAWPTSPRPSPAKRTAMASGATGRPWMRPTTGRPWVRVTRAARTAGSTSCRPQPQTGAMPPRLGLAMARPFGTRQASSMPLWRANHSPSQSQQHAPCGTRQTRSCPPPRRCSSTRPGQGLRPSKPSPQRPLKRLRPAGPSPRKPQAQRHRSNHHSQQRLHSSNLSDLI